MEKSDNTKILNKITFEKLEEIYTTMLRIRIFEEKVTDLLCKKQIHCPVHLYTGQEAIAAGVCASLREDDYAFSTHRSHGHFIAKGGSLNALMSELYGKVTGCSRGRGGSMHIVDPEVGFMGSSAIVAGTIPIAVGGALSAKRSGKEQVSIVFFGDGATDEGVFYESLNFASLYQLPVVFICENNLFSTHMPLSKRQSNQVLFEKVKVFNIPSERIDGNDPIKVYIHAKAMIENARSGKGPSFLECMTFRWFAHVGPTPDLDIGYRKKKDVEYWMRKCPIKAIKKILNKMEDWDKKKEDVIKKIVDSEVEKAVDFAKESAFPEVKNIAKGLFTNSIEA